MLNPRFLLPLTLSQICLHHPLPLLPLLRYENCLGKVRELHRAPTGIQPRVFPEVHWPQCLPPSAAFWITSASSFPQEFAFCFAEKAAGGVPLSTPTISSWRYHPHTPFVPSVPVYLHSRSSPFLLPLAVASVIPFLPRISRLSFPHQVLPSWFQMSLRSLVWSERIVPARAPFSFCVLSLISVSGLLWSLVFECSFFFFKSVA